MAPSHCTPCTASVATSTSACDTSTANTRASASRSTRPEVDQLDAFFSVDLVGVNRLKTQDKHIGRTKRIDSCLNRDQASMFSLT